MIYQRIIFQKHIDVFFVLNWLVSANIMLVTLANNTIPVLDASYLKLFGFKPGRKQLQ